MHSKTCALYPPRKSNGRRAKYFALTVIAAMLSTGSAPTVGNAADPSTPDWPCVQRKIETLTPTQMWDGPAIEEGMPWRNSNEIRKLVQFLMSRRIPMEEAEKAIEKFSSTLDADKKDAQLTLLFAGFLDATNSRRGKIMRGIEKMNIRQRARAEELERQGVAIAELEKRERAGEKDLKTSIRKAQKEYDWDARVFKERQENLPVGCEIPVLIEQRAFEMARSIRNLMSN